MGFFQPLKSSSKCKGRSVHPTHRQTAHSDDVILCIWDNKENVTIWDNKEKNNKG